MLYDLFYFDFLKKGKVPFLPILARGCFLFCLLVLSINPLLFVFCISEEAPYLRAYRVLVVLSASNDIFSRKIFL